MLIKQDDNLTSYSITRQSFPLSNESINCSHGMVLANHATPKEAIKQQNNM